MTSKATTVGSVNVRGEVFSWTDEAGKHNATIEMMASGISWLPIIGTNERLYAYRVPARGF
jgi:hypothetical protein